MKERGPPRVGAVPGLRLAADEVHATRTVIRRTERRTSWRLVVPGRWTPRATDAQLGKAMLGKIFELFQLSDRPFVLLISIILAVASPILGQDDVTTRNGASAYGGAFITGPASNPLSFLNGDAYLTFASQSPYLIPDFAPAVLLNEQLPKWIGRVDGVPGQYWIRRNGRARRVRPPGRRAQRRRLAAGPAGSPRLS